MRIGILTQYYPPEIGAPQSRLSDLARRMALGGHEVTVLTAMPSYPLGRVYAGYGGVFRRERREGVRVLRCWIYPTKSVRMLPRLANYFSFVFMSLVLGAVSLPRLDFLLTESPPLFLGITGFLLTRLKRARWIFNVSDLWPDTAVQLGIIREGRLVSLARRLEAFCYRNAWLVTGQTRGILADISRRFPGVETYHLSNGVDTEAFSPGRRNNEARHALAGLDGDSDGTCIVFYGGLHGVAQGLDQILEAAARLQDLRRLFFVLVGDGVEKERLIRMRDEMRLQRVDFREPVPRDQLAQLLASSDIAVIPLKMAIAEAVPSKLYEAMGSAVPVVLIAEGEAAEIVRQSHSGLVVPPGDIDGLAGALRELAQSPERRRRLGLRGRETAERRFDRENIAREFLCRIEGPEGHVPESRQRPKADLQ